jgi:aminoglycoside phosphotransferase (APT) family kinase protein
MMPPPAQSESAQLLSNAEAVRAFLMAPLGLDPAGAQIEFLSGGVSSTVVRVVVGSHCFVIKQALPRLRVEATWLSRPERSGIEARFAEVLTRLVPGSVPRVLRVVSDSHAFVMECAPVGSETWKEHLMRGTVDLETAGAAGALLARIHTRTAASPWLASEFADQSFFTELRLEPYLHHTASQHPDLARELDALVDGLRVPGTCLVHGDYSPKNLLVTPVGDLLILDHEVAHWGQPAFDVAFALSHLCLKSVRFRGAGLHGQAATAFLTAYRATSSVADAATGALCGRLLAGLMLARVDGKSPVEYLTEEDKVIVRRLAGRALRERAADPDAVLGAVRRVVADA